MALTTSLAKDSMMLALAKDSIMLDTRSPTMEECPLTVEQIMQLKAWLKASPHWKTQRTTTPSSGIKKVIGLIKKVGPNMGKLFSCLRNADGKTVANSYKVLENTLLTDVADFKSGRKVIGDKVKNWQCWTLKAPEEGLVLGSYEEEIVPAEEEDEDDVFQS